MDVEAFGRRSDPLADLPQPVEINAGLAAALVVGEVLRRFDARPAAVEPISLLAE
jgi:hypothetical protein